MYGDHRDLHVLTHSFPTRRSSDLIAAYSNPLSKRVRNLRDKRHRREECLFLAEGLRILTEARETGRLPEMLFFARQSANHPLVQTLVEAVEAAGGDAIETTPDILATLSGTDNPQAVVGVLDRKRTRLTSSQ